MEEFFFYYRYKYTVQNHYKF